jgi:hypothetical protein
MKKAFFLLPIVLMVFLGACASGSASKKDQLDLAIRETSDYLNSNVTAGNKLVILNIQSDYPALSEYIIDELIANTVNDKIFTIVDRQQLDAIRAELNFQLSGEVDDKSAQELGRMLGAQTIISGVVSKVGDIYRMRVRALGVQTAQIEGQFNRNIDKSPLSDALAKSSSASGTQTAQSRPAAPAQSTSAPATSTAAPAAPAARTYRVGDTGPAGGIIFYDKGSNTGGWRYLEAAPSETDRVATMLPNTSINRIIDNLADRRLGAGKNNTQMLNVFFEDNRIGMNTAAWHAYNLEINGFEDWYLPSIEELLLMYNNIYARDRSSGFRMVKYWSSSYPGRNATCVDFASGKEDIMWTSDNDARVRACRQF